MSFGGGSQLQSFSALNKGSHSTSLGGGGANGESWGQGAPLSETAAQERDIGLSTFDVIYAPLCLLCFFFTFLLMSRKLPRFHNASLRHYLAHYINAEVVYETLKNSDDEEIQQHRQLETGHLCFEAFGVVVLIFNLILNVDQTRFPFLILSVSQMGLATISITIDFILLKKGYVHVVRGTNSKLRFAHSSYQSLLFALDGITAGRGLGTLPVDCYYCIFTHYAYESVGEVLEGCFASGSGDLIIGLLIVAHAMTNEDLSTGKIAAFGVSCLVLSCLSLIGGSIYKIYHANHTKRRYVQDDHHHGVEVHHDADEEENSGEHSEHLLKRHAESELKTFVDGNREDESDEIGGNSSSQKMKKKSAKVVEIVPPPPPQKKELPRIRGFLASLMSRRKQQEATISQRIKKATAEGGNSPNVSQRTKRANSDATKTTSTKDNNDSQRVKRANTITPASAAPASSKDGDELKYTKL